MSEEADTIAKVIEESSEMPMDMPDFDPSKMPTRDQLLDMLDSMGLGDQEKEELRAALMEDDPFASPVPSIFSSQFMVLASFLLLIALIFVFFGYKLYKSLKDKEVKREEKRRLKQLKKKK